MKKARLILSASMLSIAAFSAVTFSSCSKDDVICPTGMEGNDCDVESRAKFLGTWTASDQKVDGTSVPTYTASISKNTSSVAKMNIGGFSGPSTGGGFAANVVVNADGATFSIPVQEPDDDGFTVEGNGTINTTTNTITIEYVVTKTLTNEKTSYTGTWIK